MPHVSRKPLAKDVFLDIMESFNWLLADINSEETMKLFIHDFFTKTERMMLAKRLAAALMISKGYEVKIIQEVLKISTNTVYRVRSWVETGGKGLELGLKKLARQEKMNAFWERVNNFIEDNITQVRMFPRIRSRD